ncbi:O-antigen ligase family protein [Clostridium sp.]|uniref:O-antigen ligase family protein n=1 Tax=Clostridium sp. TaxID=1506 RepID=UPI0025C17436|nr:O-antigen ligase family protein [Clostridium sp.]
MKLIKKKNLILNILNILFILSLPMMPLFTRNGYYTLGLIIVFFSFLIFIRNKIYLTSFEKMEIVFTICIIGSILYSYNIGSSIDVLTKNIRIVLFSIATVRLSFILNKNIDISVYKVGKYFVIGTVIISIYIFFAEFGVRRINNRYGEIVFSKEYGTYITYSYNLIISICFIIYSYIFNCKIKKEKIKTFLLGSLIFIFILLSGTRKAMIIPILFAIMITFINARQNAIKIIKYVIISLIVLIIIYYTIMNVEIFYNFIGYRIESLLAVNSSIKDNSMMERILMRDYAWELFLRNPVLGHGAGTFRDYFIQISGKYLYSHNNHLEILSGLGIIGYIVFYGWLINILSNLYKLIKEGDEISIGFFSFILIQIFLDYGTVSYNSEQYILIYCLAAMYYYCKKRYILIKD